MTGGMAPSGGDRGAPLIVTAEMPPDILSWVDGLRRAHYPAERNQVRAHVTLFHALPPWIEAEARSVLAELAGGPSPEAALSGVMDLGRGTAFAIDCPEILQLRDQLADRFHGLLSAQDAHRIRLHVTIQNKVSLKEAGLLQADLAARFRPRRFRFHGIALNAYEGGPWRHIRSFAFRGRG